MMNPKKDLCRRKSSNLTLKFEQVLLTKKLIRKEKQRRKILSKRIRKKARIRRNSRMKRKKKPISPR